MRRCMSLAIAIGLAASLSISGAIAFAQTDTGYVAPTVWTSYDGGEIEAEFVKLDGETVVLKLKTTGKEVPVPLSRLSLDSHYHAVRLGNPEAFNKPLVKAEVPAEVEPFVPKETLPVDDLLTSPYPKNPTIEQFLDISMSETSRGNLFVSWHGLPPKMQNDIEALVVRGANKLGSQTINQIKALMKSVNIIVSEKKDFILGYPAVAAQREVVSGLETNWGLLSGFVGAITKESNWQMDNFQAGKVPSWLAGLSAELGPFLDPGIKAAQNLAPPGVSIPSMSEIDYKILSQSGDKAQVEMIMGANGLSTPVTYQKVGDIWLVPTQMNQLRAGIDQANAALDQEFDASAVNVVLFALNAAAGSLQRSSTQEEFNEAIDNLANLPGLSSLGGGGNGPGVGGPRAGGPGSRGPGAGGPDGPMGAGPGGGDGPAMLGVGG